MLKLLSELIQNRCVNPPGGEMRSIKSIERYLHANGINSSVYESAPGRGNLVAKITGSADGHTLMFGPGHVDVAPVNDTEAWCVDPFTAIVNDGYVWGRGSHDMLFMVTAHVQAFIDLYKSEYKPNGNLLLFVVSDEEDSGTFGTSWMIEHYPDAVQADYAVSEAGGWFDEKGAVVFTYGERGDPITSPTDSTFVSAMKKAIKIEMPTARLVPELMPGKTDLKHMRRQGVEAYGFGLYDPDTPSNARIVHGPNERISLKTLELTHRACTNLARILLFPRTRTGISLSLNRR